MKDITPEVAAELNAISSEILNKLIAFAEKHDEALALTALATIVARALLVNDETVEGFMHAVTFAWRRDYRAALDVPSTSPTGRCDPSGCDRPCGRCAARVARGCEF